MPEYASVPSDDVEKLLEKHGVGDTTSTEGMSDVEPEANKYKECFQSVMIVMFRLAAAWFWLMFIVGLFVIFVGLFRHILTPWAPTMRDVTWGKVIVPTYGTIITPPLNGEGMSGKGFKACVPAPLEAFPLCVDVACPNPWKNGGNSPHNCNAYVTVVVPGYALNNNVTLIMEQGDNDRNASVVVSVHPHPSENVTCEAKGYDKECTYALFPLHYADFNAKIEGSVAGNLSLAPLFGTMEEYGLKWKERSQSINRSLREIFAGVVLSVIGLIGSFIGFLGSKE